MGAAGNCRLKDHPGYRRLLGVKGIGPVLAAVFVAQISDVSRFPNAAALCCWAGITPRRRGKDARNTAKVAAGRVMLETVYYLLRDGESRRLTHHVAA